MTTVHPLPGPEESVLLDGDRVTITSLHVEDRALADLLRGASPGDRAATAARALEVGARSLLAGGVGIDVDAVDARVQRTLASVTEEAERRIGMLLTEGERAFQESFDPGRRTSLVARALDDFGTWRDEVLAGLDPDRAGSRTTVFLERMNALLGPGGALESRLTEALDPSAEGSAMARLTAVIDAGMQDLRDLLVRDEGHAAGRAEEAAKGTRQGFDYEDVVEAIVRAEAAALGGCVVERTAAEPGALHNAKVGDFVVTLPGGQRVVVEAKHQASLTLAGRDGVLAELDRAIANREADAAVCVSGKPAFPAEVGTFNVYGNRVLVVDDGDGTMLSVALRWAVATARAAGGAGAGTVDPALLTDRVERIKALGTRFTTAQRQLTDVATSVQGVKDLLAGTRRDLLELTDDLQHAVGRPAG
jgi:hypothetical protein